VYFGALCVVSAVVIGVFWGKTWEQQAMNVILGFAAGVLTSGAVLLVQRMRRAR
jgi:uncharacterized protein involved in exopolysaccharide biosynthesis